MNWYKKQLKISYPVGVRRGWSDEDLQMIKELIDGGSPLSQIASLFDVSPSTIRVLNEKYKWKEKKNYNPPIQWSEEDLEKIKSLILQDKSFRSIASLFGVGDVTIANLNKKYKWKDLKADRLKKDNFIASLYLLHPDGKGMSAKAIAAQYGINPSTTMQALRRLDKLDFWRGQSEAQKQKYIYDPDSARVHSEKLKQVHKDRPEIGEQQSIRMKEYWDEIGKLEGLLLSYPTKEQAVKWLNGFYHRLLKMNKIETANQIYNKYMKIINDHTYPDEIEQQI